MSTGKIINYTNVDNVDIFNVSLMKFFTKHM